MILRIPNLLPFSSIFEI